MATFEMPKSVDDIQEAQLLKDEWYLMRIVQEPSIEDNKKKKDGLSPEDGAGQNLVLKLRVQDEDPMVNGRAFTKWLPWPNEADGSRADAFTGQPMVDKKMEAIVAWVEAFGGSVEGSELNLSSGSEAYVFVTTEVGLNGEPQNSIDFNQLPKAV